MGTAALIFSCIAQRGITTRMSTHGLASIYIDVPALRPGTVGAYALALAAVAVATALELAIDRYIGGARYVTFLLPIIVTALISGLGASLFCLAISVAAVHFFLLQPGFSWYDELLALPALALFILAGLSSVILITGMRSAIEREHLQESKARLQFALDAARLGWWRYDGLSRVVSGDTRFKEIFDLTVDEMPIDDMKGRIHPDDAERFWADHEASLDHAGPQQFEHQYRILRRDGEVRWVEGRWLVHFEGVGREQRATSIVGTLRDITERKHHEELLQRQADLLDQSHDAILTMQTDGRGVVYWSRGAERLYGYTAAEAEGRRTHELLQTRAPIPIEDIDAQIVHEGSWYGELTHTTRDGRDIVVESHIVRVSYNGDTLALETNRDITERKRAEERLRLLMREINHRAKNMLAVVDAIAHQTATARPEEFIERFSERIKALAANQDLLIRNEWRGVEIADLVRGQLAPFASFIGRIALHGPKLRLKPAAAQAIGLALHELATNATKYGAFSTDKGRVDIAWRIIGDTCAMSWTECGGPPVSPPNQRGFGTTVIQAMAERSVDGVVDLDYAHSGVTWRLTCPAANLLESPGNVSNGNRAKAAAKL
jgi:PAS domain S-box-containing protein